MPLTITVNEPNKQHGDRLVSFNYVRTRRLYSVNDANHIVNQLQQTLHEKGVIGSLKIILVCGDHRLPIKGMINIGSHMINLSNHIFFYEDLEPEMFLHPERREIDHLYVMVHQKI